MAARNFERQRAALEEIRRDPASPGAVAGLRRFLRGRNNFLAAKAAEIAAAQGRVELIPEMLEALGRFFVDPVKSDPQCWAKHGLVEALSALGHDNPETFLRGLRHIQMEPVWGGAEDTAGRLRAACAQALTSCRDIGDLQLLSYLVEVLVDPDKTVRAEAARAIGRLERPEAALLVRLRALTGDDEPEVVGACLSAVLAIEGAGGIAFVQGFLERGGDPGAEAALALGLTRTKQALEILQRKWESERDPRFRETLLAAIAQTRLEEAIGFLLQLVASDAPGAIVAATALHRLGGDLRDRLEDAVKRSGSERLRAELKKMAR